MSVEANFWEKKSLTQMNQAEWEALCDGCAKCCLLKFQDEDSETIYYTHIVCQYLHHDKCQCRHYEDRHQLVTRCVKLTPENINQFSWLPSTCAYRLIHEGEPLPAWHHLISGDRNTIHELNESIKDKVISESYVHPDSWQEHIIHWVK